MPIYEYECRKCGVFEYRQSISDDTLKRCPKCRSGVQKLLSASAFHLKGGGWYSDGYDKKTGSESANSTGAAASSESASATKSSGESAKASKSTKSGKPGKSAKSSGKDASGS